MAGRGKDDKARGGRPASGAKGERETLLRDGLGRLGLRGYLRRGGRAGGAEGGLGKAGAGQQYLTALQQIHAGVAVSQGSCDEGYEVIFVLEIRQ